jgi:CRP/FNR family transcriptional regulator, cyclic AMP receptor protein
MRKALYFLGLLNDSDVDWLLLAGEKRDFATGSTLVVEGKPIDSLFLVIDGHFSVTIGGTSGKEVAQLMSGEIIGEISFVDSHPPSASVMALRGSSVLAIPRVRLATKLTEDSAFAARFYRCVAVFLADRLRSTTATLGYGSSVTGSEGAIEQDLIYKDEIDPDTLDGVSIAGARFDWIQRRLRAE